MNKNERQQALKALVTVLNDHTPLSYLTAPLSPFSRELCFGVCRHYYRLEWIAQQFVKKKPKDLEVWLNILMGLYQLHYLRTPAYAVVKESVDLLSTNHLKWAKGLVNAVLRNYCRQADALAQTSLKHPAFIHGHPVWFQKRMQKAWPDEWQTILTANDMHPPLSLRVNTRHETAKTYISRLEQQSVHATLHQYASHGLTLTTPCDVQTLPGFHEGHVSVQDEAAQLAVSLLDLQPGLRVLDACSAPGGKTCHMLETEPHLQACVAVEIDAKRLARVRENLNRLHLHATLIEGDAQTPEVWWDGHFFDRILLDAPCSATGVIRRHPDIKILRTEEDIRQVTSIQANMLEALWPLLAEHGRLVYATCSVMPEENEHQLAKFVTKHPDCIVHKESQAWGKQTGHGWQILPGQHNMDGFFYGVLEKITPCLTTSTD
jgi:16S rRNA (cytosine967-C5)-methyltransferase